MCNENVTNEVKDKKALTKEIFEWLEVIISALVVVVVIFTFIFRIATIVGDSMQNTFFEGQKVVITNWFYTPKAGDVVVVSRNVENSGAATEDNGPIIKRVIATEGQQVNIDFMNGIVYVDGVALDEPYTKTPTNMQGDVQFPVYVPEGHVFCLGDNRNESLDSRFSLIGNEGMIDTRYILGKVTLRILPLSDFGKVD